MRRLAASLFLLASAGACAGEGNDDDHADEAAVRDNTAAQDLVIEGQLRGATLPQKVLHLTFDDGPGPRTAELADYLAESQIKATFFINGTRLAALGGAARHVVARGHLLANHTYGHLLLPRQSPERMVDEIRRVDDFIVDAQPGRPAYRRMPYACYNGIMERALHRSPINKYVGPIHWDIGTSLTATSAADWNCWSTNVSVERCGDLYLAEIRAKGRGIVLFHDIHGKTVDMVKRIVPQLREEGFTFTDLESVPQIKEAAATARKPLGDSQCFSGTLMRVVEEGTCVRSDFEGKPFRCASGDWRSTAPDASCRSR